MGPSRRIGRPSEAGAPGTDQPGQQRPLPRRRPFGSGEQVSDPLADYRRRQADQQRAARDRLFPDPGADEQSTEPEGDVDAGRGDAPLPTYVTTTTGERMRVFTDDELADHPKEAA